MSGLTQVILSPNILNVSDVERILSQSGSAFPVTLEVVPWRATVAETMFQVVLLQRVLNLVVEALDLAVEPLRRIEEASVVTAGGDSSGSEEVFEECSSE